MIPSNGTASSSINFFFRMTQRPRVFSNKILFRGDYFTVMTSFVTLPDGTRITREIAERRSSVAVVAVDADKKVLLVEEYQPAIQRIALGLPGGQVDQGERSVQSAKRELREETGFSAAEWKLLYNWPGAGSWIWPRTCYLARKLSNRPLPQDPEERIVVKRLPLKRAVQMAIKGQLDTSDTCLALIRAYELIYRKKLL